jgi:hypothetical protein
MKNFIKFFLAGLVLLALPVVLWNVWFLDYVDKQGKLVPFLLTPVFAFVCAAIIVGMSDVEDKPVINGTINPFWGWFIGSLLVGIMIVLLSNT